MNNKVTKTKSADDKLIAENNSNDKSRLMMLLNNQEMKRVPQSILSKIQRPEKCAWFTYQHPDHSCVLAEEFFEEEEGDAPMNEPLVVVCKHNNEIVPLVGLQCLFSECAGGNFYVFRSILTDKKCFIKFKDVLKVYVIRGWCKTI